MLLSLKINVNEYVKARLLEVIDELYLTYSNGRGRGQ